MSAELLRRAAKEMREKAEAATAGPWGVHVYPALSGHFAVYSEAGTVPGSRLANCGKDHGAAADAEHIASWHPAVALGIASLFDNLADEWERARPCEKDCANCSDMHWSWPTAELVAKDFLGEAS